MFAAIIPMLLRWLPYILGAIVVGVLVWRVESWREEAGLYHAEHAGRLAAEEVAKGNADTLQKYEAACSHALNVQASERAQAQAEAQGLADLLRTVQAQSQRAGQDAPPAPVLRDALRALAGDEK